jgi:alcohol dehydrogenase class IV
VNFSYETLPLRVHFGAGRAADHVAAEVERLGAHRVLLVATARETPRARTLLAGVTDRCVGSFSAVRQHVPAATAAEAVRTARDSAADAVVCVGGGSTTGTAKAVAKETGLPIIAVPTTYAGSEVTPVWGITTDARKETGTDPRVLPVAVVYDPDLLGDLPVEIAVPSAFNALAHCVEAFWTPRANPVTSVLATEGVRALGGGLRAATAGHAEAGREELLYGAYLAGTVFATAGSGLHHKICHALGGAFDLPHAPLHTVVLPHVLAFNTPAVPQTEARIAGALGSPTAREGLDALYAATGAPRSLEAIGLRADQLEEAVDVVAAKLPIDNPRPLSRTDVADLLRAAFEARSATAA